MQVMNTPQPEPLRGAFCWRELATPDLQGASAFYGELMGWDVGLNGDDAIAARVLCGGREVATMRRPLQELGEDDGEACWLSFISVVSVQETTRRARDLGGEILSARADIPGCKEAAIIADPSGARVVLCHRDPAQAMAAPGGSPGTCCWTELSTRDAQRAAVFYAQLLGWKARVVMHESAPSTLFLVEDTPVAGLQQLNGEPPIPSSSWVVSFEVADADEAVRRALHLGGRQRSDISSIPCVGRTADLVDPQGASFSILEPHRDD